MKTTRLLPLVVMMTLTGCVSREGALRSRNFERVHIEATPEQIAKAAERHFAAHGFQRASESNPQAMLLQKRTPLLFRSIKGGNARVWLILEPRASGWDVYCLPEPDGLYPGGNAPRFRGLLAKIQEDSEAKSSSNSNPR